MPRLAKQRLADYGALLLPASTTRAAPAPTATHALLRNTTLLHNTAADHILPSLLNLLSNAVLGQASSSVELTYDPWHMSAGEQQLLDTGFALLVVSPPADIARCSV